MPSSRTSVRSHTFADECILPRCFHAALAALLEQPNARPGPVRLLLASAPLRAPVLPCVRCMEGVVHGCTVGGTTIRHSSGARTQDSTCSLDAARARRLLPPGPPHCHRRWGAGLAQPGSAGIARDAGRGADSERGRQAARQQSGRAGARIAGGRGRRYVPAACQSGHPARHSSSGGPARTVRVAAGPARLSG